MTTMNSTLFRLKETISDLPISNDFVAGYDLDWDQKYRNLPYIGIVQ